MSYFGEELFWRTVILVKSYFGGGLVWVKFLCRPYFSHHDNLASIVFIQNYLLRFVMVTNYKYNEVE